MQCGLCGLRYDVSARTARDVRAGRVEPRCQVHRRKGARPKIAVAENRRFWLDRFDDETLAAMNDDLAWFAGRAGLRPSQTTDSVRVVTLALVAAAGSSG